MTAKERILAIKLLEKLEYAPEYAVQLGIQVGMIKRESQDDERRKL